MRNEEFGSAGLEAIDDVIGDGVHEANHVAFAEKFLAEGVEALDFAAAAIGGVGFVANARGQLAAGNGGDEKGDKSNPVLGIGDGERADRRQEKIVEQQHGVTDMQTETTMPQTAETAKIARRNDKATVV